MAKCFIYDFDDQTGWLSNQGDKMPENASKVSTILLGKGLLAIRIAEWFLTSQQYELTCVVPVIPEPTWTDSLGNWARERGVPYIETGNYYDMQDVRQENWRVDLAFSVFYSTIFPPWFINKCHRILNLHNGPLPRYRGASPINWALKNGEIMHGVTIHEVIPRIDSGPIVAQIQYSIYSDFDEVRDVYARAIEYAWVLFQQTMPILDKIEPRPQDESQATYYGRRRNNELGDRRSWTRKETV
jgi:methionyl-tRNA formyltransferase